jgi:hypothetical protein
MITLKLLDSIQDIEKKINKASSEVINQKLNNSLQTIKNSVKSVASSYILQQPEIQSLYGGYLQGAFGKINASSSAESIRLSVLNSISVVLDKFNPSLKGSLSINIQPNDFLNLLSLTEGHTIYEGGDLHWLNWLLTKGDSIIIIDYYYDPQGGIGRTGLGNMKGGGSFRVPPEFSGTIENNFITRALTNDSIIKNINSIIEKAIQ